MIILDLHVDGRIYFEGISMLGTSKKTLMKDDKLSIYESYEGSMLLLKSYEKELNEPFLHTLMSELQLLNDGSAVQRSASLDWNVAAQPWLLDKPEGWMPESIVEPATITALGGFLTIRTYIANIASETESVGLARFVDVLDSALTAESSVNYCDPAWIRWSQCVASAKKAPDLIKLQIISPQKNS